MPAHPLPLASLRPLVTAKPETLWRTVFEQSHLGIVLIDPATDRIIDLNQRFADLAGRSRDALRGQDWMHLTHPDDLPLEIEHKTQLRQGQIPCFLRDKRYVHPDGTVVWVHVNETRVTVAEGEPPCFLAMVEDVTEQRQTRLALRAEREAAARYEQERQKCMTNNTQDSLATCLREAGAAQDAARKGQLSNPGPQAADNATQRCSAFQNADEQAECVRRVQGPASGSVSAGGVLRESVTTTVVPQ